MSTIQDLSDVVIAQQLHERGVVVAPPRIVNFADQTVRQLTTVLVNYNGLRTSISGQVGATSKAMQAALQTARQQVDAGVAHIGLAVVYPKTEAQPSYETLKTALPTRPLRVATVTEAAVVGFKETTLDGLGELLAQAFEQLTREDVVAQAATLLDSGIESFARVTASQNRVVAYFSYKLGIPEQREGLPTPRQIAKLTPEQRGAICRIGGLVLMNAMLTQATLAKQDERVIPLPQMLRETDLPAAFSEHWDFIVDNINYYSLFHLATELMESLTPMPDVLVSLQNLLRIAQRIVNEQGLALRHDLMGRVYHRLLAEAKYLGIFYTTIPAATLLLKLALDVEQKWHDLSQLRNLKIADLSCGTGTLLMAAAETIGDNYISATTSAGRQPDYHGLHQAMLESMLHGYDVLPSAVHLTASSLALRTPAISFERLNLFSLPLGGHEHRLGSIEFLRDQDIEVPFDMFAPQLKIRQISPASEDEVMVAELPQLDLCVINPPFTRSVGGNLLFGSVPERERTAMQRKLKKLVQQPDVHANTTAGLGSIFVAIADKHLKVGGRLAFVLPKACISGVAWAATRRLLRLRYRVDYIISSQDPQRWNFSESTELSEVLIVATKIAAAKSESDSNDEATPLTETLSPADTFPLTPNAVSSAPPPTRRSETATPSTDQNGEVSVLHRWQHKPTPRPEFASNDDEQVVSVNLWRNPQSSFEALSLAFALTHRENLPTVSETDSALPLTVGDVQIGEAMSLPWATLKSRSTWMLPAAFAQADLIRAAYHLEKGAVWLPQIGDVGQIPLRPLSEFGTLGPDRRDIHDGFSITTERTEYPAFWGQSAAVKQLSQQPNRYLIPLNEAKKGRPFRNPDQLWARSGRLLLLERLRLNTQSTVAVRTPQPVLSNMWWEFCYDGALYAEEVEKALALWLNSTLGLLLLLTQRQETQGAWVAFKKPTLAALPVLDLHALTPSQRSELAFIHDELATETLLPFPEMHIDLIRAEIDQALSQTLDLPDLTPVRDLLASEPVVCNQRL